MSQLCASTALCDVCHIFIQCVLQNMLNYHALWIRLSI